MGSSRTAGLRRAESYGEAAPQVRFTRLFRKSESAASEVSKRESFVDVGMMAGTPKHSGDEAGAPVAACRSTAGSNESHQLASGDMKETKP